MTPMVHWPETMMTFDETEGVLFAGDGFGCFGTLDGGFLDTRINLEQILGRDGALLFQHRGQVRLSGAERHLPSWAVCPFPPSAPRTGRCGRRI